jgi:hypothetical protein
MAPAALLNDCEYGGMLLDRASTEIERMRTAKKGYHGFPHACLTLLQNIEGNSRCIDCGSVLMAENAWGAVSYGALMCLNCSGHHRSLGVQVSCVRSVSMDEWSVEQIVCMLEGGNRQLAGFFSRHALSEDSCPLNKTITPQNVNRLRYKTKAALFYRQQLDAHVARVLRAGPYRGRDVSRRLRLHRSEPRSTTVE